MSVRPVKDAFVTPARLMALSPGASVATGFTMIALGPAQPVVVPGTGVRTGSAPLTFVKPPSHVT